MTLPTPPPGMKAPGRALWDHVLAELELDPHELAVLGDACRTADVIRDLDREVRRLGPMVEGGRSGLKVNPAIVEVRHQRLVFARLVSALRLPAGLSEEASSHADLRRPQRRAGVKGLYSLPRSS